MRKWKIVGFKNVHYTSRKTNKPVSGIELYIVSDPTTPDITGVEARVIWVSSRVSFVPAIGADVNIFYDDRGNVEAIVPAAE